MSNWKMNQLPVEGASNVPQMRVEDYDQVIKSNNVVLVDIGAGTQSVVKNLFEGLTLYIYFQMYPSAVEIVPFAVV